MRKMKEALMDALYGHNKEFHEWFYSVESRQKYGEQSAAYTYARQAWDESKRRTSEAVAQMGWGTR